MSSFARRAIEALKAGDRQAMIICHTDAKHPHVHVVLNRVSPEDGRMLSSSNEKLALSALALAYEKECGAILCPERAENAAKRARGEYVRGKKAISRRLYEALLRGRREADKDIPAQLAKQRPQAAADLRAATQRRERSALGHTYKAEIRKTFGEIKAACRLAVQKIFGRSDPGGLAPHFNPAASRQEGFLRRSRHRRSVG